MIITLAITALIVNFATGRAADQTPVVAVLCFANQTTLPGIESDFTHIFQRELAAATQGRYLVVDFSKTQAALTEPGNMQKALDAGRSAGADLVVTGAIGSEAENRLRVSMKLIKVPQGNVVKEARTVLRFDSRDTLLQRWSEAARKMIVWFAE